MFRRTGIKTLIVLSAAAVLLFGFQSLALAVGQPTSLGQRVGATALGAGEFTNSNSITFSMYKQSPVPWGCEDWVGCWEIQTRILVNVWANNQIVTQLWSPWDSWDSTDPDETDGDGVDYEEVTWSSVPEGNYTWEARVELRERSSNYNDNPPWSYWENSSFVEFSPGSFSFNVDRSGPISPSIIINYGVPFTNSPVVNLGLNAYDGGSGLSQMWVYNWAPVPPWPPQYEAYQASKTWTLPAGDGQKTVVVKFRDALGNVSNEATASINLDTTGPSAPGVSTSHAENAWSKDNTVDMNVSASSDGSGSGVARYRYKWTQNQSDDPDVNPTEEVTGPGGFSRISNALADGLWWLRVRAYDALGNWGGTTTKGSFRIDTTAPTLNITGGPSGTTTDSSPTFTFSGSDGSGSGGVTYSYRLSTGSWSADSGSTTGEVFPSVGQNTFQVRARDALGNERIVPQDFIYNAVPTAVIQSISPNPAIQGQNVSFAGTGIDSGGAITAYSWRSSIDGPLSNSAIFSKNNLSVGTHTIFFKVQDNDGVWSEEVPFQLTIVSPSTGGQNPGGQNPGNQTPSGGTTQQILNTLLSLSAQPKAIQAGKAVTVKGQLKDSAGKGVAGKKVVLKQKVLKKIKKKVKGKIKTIKKWIWKAIANLTTDSKGNFAKKLKPKATTIYKAEYAGDSSYKAANSNAVKVTVKKAKKK